MEKLWKDERVQAALAFIEQDNDATTEEQIELTEIEAPTFAEAEKGRAYRAKLETLGLEEVATDAAGNVFGRRRGKGSGPTLVLCAHLDTVFPAGTDVKAKRRDGKVFAPGIADDGRGLAAVLAVLRALQSAGIETEGDLLIGATVGEEGLGDLNGVKHLFAERGDEIDGFISIEPGAPDRITYLATGSKRYSVKYRGPGGHSFGDYGTPSPVHALGRAIAEISSVRTPELPKTTYNVGVIGGGTSVNTIAEEAEMILDLRSTSADELARLEREALRIIHQAADEENRFRGRPGAVSAELEQVGDRPAGSQDPESTIVRIAANASRLLGYDPVLEGASSTDSNVPIHLGIPAVTLGGGGEFGGCHTLGEWFDPNGAFVGVQKVLLTVLALVGVPGVAGAGLEVREKAVR
ncbi:M20/M25/M40 family metallo-hydrolase [Bhargavaea ullalensis]|uniref:Acetylornithine deacetylase/succinyl-diaminopimelate desuccinylase-like protein n=1 Tax=Bhargavaea ullalensis TaxID=1265685 RepID=A0ABV2GD19_9BACL